MGIQRHGAPVAAALAGSGRAREVAAAFDRLNVTAIGLGLDLVELRRIIDSVEAEARASGTSGPIEDRVAEARRRLFAAAGVGTSRRD